jgi:low affinity Fe/Cu permease
MFIKSRFEILSEWISQNLGHPYAFLTAGAVVVIWALVGPLFQYSDTWQLVINTGTTIVTFLMVFLLQNTGNRGIKNTDRRLEVLEQQNRMLIDQLRQLVDNTNKRGL